MQPSPMAETAGPLVPNLRIFIVCYLSQAGEPSVRGRQRAIVFRLDNLRTTDTDALFNLAIVGDFMGQERMSLLQFNDLRGDGSLVIFENLAPFQRGGVADFT
jgi:hypothetical protein